jgi:hypothetical protein
MGVLQADVWCSPKRASYCQIWKVSQKMWLGSPLRANIRIVVWVSRQPYESPCSQLYTQLSSTVCSPLRISAFNTHLLSNLSSYDTYPKSPAPRKRPALCLISLMPVFQPWKPSAFSQVIHCCLFFPPGI